MESKPNFPYKTLIWALFALVAIFLFRKPLHDLLSHAEGVSIFGVEITASKEKVQKLQDSIHNFETTIANLSSQLANQQNELNTLDRLKTKLEQDLAQCPEARNTSALFSNKVNQISSANRDLTTKSIKLINSSIFKTTTYNVKLVLPSNMLDAEIFVDGKNAMVLKKSGVYVTVKVIKKKTNHSFVIKQGNKTCRASRLITKEDTEIPIVCDF